jgi:hypothetical protein
MITDIKAFTKAFGWHFVLWAFSVSFFVLFGVSIEFNMWVGTPNVIDVFTYIYICAGGFIALVGWFVSCMTLFDGGAGDLEDCMNKFRRLRKHRIKAIQRGSQIEILESGGNNWARSHGVFSPDDAEIAIETMIRLKSKTQEGEAAAKNLVKILNKG